MTLWNDRPDAWHEAQAGVRRRILSHGDGVMVTVYEIAPNTTIKRHSHKIVQSGTLLEGGATFRVGKEVYRVVRGSSWSIPSGLPHEFVSGPKGPCRVVEVFVPEREDILDEALPPDQK